MFVISLVFVQVVVFGVLIMILRRIMSENVSSATRHLEDLGQDYARKEEDINRQLGEIQHKSEEAIRQAREEADKVRENNLKEIEVEKDKIISSARTQADNIIQQAEKSRQLLIEEIEERIAKTSVDRACELIQDTLPEQFKEDVHQHWIEELVKAGFSQVERLHIPSDIEEVKITSAFAFKEEQRKAIIKKLKEVLKREVKIKEEVDATIVAGVVISMGNLVLDGSLKNKIQEQVRNNATATD